MNTLYTIVWLFPIIFMIHDFEEIIITAAWKERYKESIASTTMKRVPFSDFISTAGFSIAVAEEFLIFSVIALVAILFDSYTIWFGMFFGIVFHMLAHVLMTLRFKHYTPGLITSILFSPMGIYLLNRSIALAGFTWQTTVLSSVLGLFFILANVVFLHKMMPLMEKWLSGYAKG